MLMLKALRHSGIRRLWFGQALSSIGDEVYRTGLIWLAVNLIGPDTGYLAAAQAASLMILSFVGGKWADHWEPVRTMVRVDLIRAAVVLLPVIYTFFAPLPFWLLVFVTVVLSGLTAFFEPAMQTVLPQVSPDTPTLRAATGVMATTIRLARMVGPAIVGFLAGVIPTIHFFTLDALTFLVSAASVRRLKAVRPSGQPKLTFGQAIASGFRSVSGSPGMGFVVFSKAVTGGTWNLAYGLGLALLVQELQPGDARAFGMTVASYGLGNFAGALYFGNRTRPRPALMMFSGYVWMGLGFVAIALCPTPFWILIAVAVTGFSGTMNEVTFFDLVQTRFPLHHMSRILRLRIATDTAFTLALMLLSPALLRWLGVRTIIHICGGIWVVVGTVGLFWFMARIEGKEIASPAPSLAINPAAK